MIAFMMLLLLQQTTSPIFNNGTYQIFDDRVVQGSDTAWVISDEEIYSTYGSRFLVHNPELMQFKFAINGYDNERGYGENHQWLLNGEQQGPLYVFGMPHPADSLESSLQMTSDQIFKVRLDMRHVFAAMDSLGTYTAFNGQSFTRENFKGVYIAGSHHPLSWDFDNLAQRSDMQLSDDDGDGIYEISLQIPASRSLSEKENVGRWVLNTDLMRFPKFSSSFPILDALYKMSLEEAELDIQADKTFMAGRLWPGVWTRDVSYAITLSLAFTHPQVSMNSLKAKVKDGRIIQDTGTGGSWPVSTDRMTWSLAAWEIYKYTGDREWLEFAYQVIKKSTEDDAFNFANTQTGLYFGEQSFLDWREQSYPHWMDPKDIYMSQALGTNVVHAATQQILSGMAQELDLEDNLHKRKETELKTAINRHLWDDSRGWYGQYMYGRRHKILSEKSETLGEALSVLYGVADQKRAGELMRSLPFMDFGSPSFYPQIPGIPPYHNNGIWPFVNAYYTWAAAKTAYTRGVDHGLSAMVRQGALFVSNMENMVAESGEFLGTELNSERQLWSVAGQLAMVNRVLFGITLNKQGISFQPLVPENWDGVYKLEGFSYRDAVLNVTLKGHGTGIKRVKINGKRKKRAQIRSDQKGVFDIEIIMNGKQDDSELNPWPHRVHPATPSLSLDKEGKMLLWEEIPDASKYRVLRNGNLVTELDATAWAPKIMEVGDEFQVQAINSEGWESFASEPLLIAKVQAQILVEAERNDSVEQEATGYSGSGYVVLNSKQNQRLAWDIDIEKTGWYAFDVRYANGHGPINTDNKCAIRTLNIDGNHVGALVMPQRGQGEWSDWWGYSNLLKIYLEKGNHTLAISLEPQNENMNGLTNEAYLDHLRFIALPDQP